MGFPGDILIEDEQAVLTTRPHWLALAPALSLVAVTVLVWVGGAVLGWWYVLGGSSVVLGLILWCIAVAATLPLPFRGGYGILRWRSTRYAITDRRLIVRYGVLRKRNRDTPLHRVQDVHLDQGILARMARAGDLTIESAGAESAIELRWMRDAEQTRRTIHRLAAERRREPEPDL